MSLACFLITKYQTISQLYIFCQVDVNSEKRLIAFICELDAKTLLLQLPDFFIPMLFRMN